MTQNVYYVYAIINPLTEKYIYIGKGKNNRCKQHLTDKQDYYHNKRLNGKIRLIREAGSEPLIVKLYENLTEDEAYNIESSLIQKYGRIGYEHNGILLNHLIDGRPPHYFGENHPWNGRKHTKETKQKLSEQAKERYRTGKQVSYMKGKSHTTETKKILSEKAKTPERRKISIQNIQKSHEAAKGKPRKETTKEKIANANAHNWEITHPNGKIETIKNLRKWAAQMQLDQGNLVKVADGILRQSKGYKVKRI